MPRNRDYTSEELDIIRNASNEKEAFEKIIKKFNDRTFKGVRLKYYKERDNRKRELKEMPLVNISIEKDGVLIKYDNTPIRIKKGKIEIKDMTIDYKSEGKNESKNVSLSDISIDKNKVSIKYDNIPITIENGMISVKDMTIKL